MSCSRETDESDVLSHFFCSKNENHGASNSILFWIKHLQRYIKRWGIRARTSRIKWKISRLQSFQCNLSHSFILGWRCSQSPPKPTFPDMGRKTCFESIGQTPCEQHKQHKPIYNLKKPLEIRITLGHIHGESDYWQLGAIPCPLLLAHRERGPLLP